MRAFIKKLGPALGEIYYGKELDWKQIQEKSRKSVMVQRPSSNDIVDVSAEANDDGNKKDI
jgi:hypothetical protein